MQLLVQQLGGIVHQASHGGEYGRMAIRATSGSQLYAYVTEEHDVHTESVWMSHGDSIDKLPEGFQAVATSEQVHDGATCKQACACNAPAILETTTFASILDYSHLPDQSTVQALTVGIVQSGMVLCPLCTL